MGNGHGSVSAENIADSLIAEGWTAGWEEAMDLAEAVLAGLFDDDGQVWGGDR